MLGLGQTGAIDPSVLVDAELAAVEAASSMSATGPVRAEMITRDEAVAHILSLIDQQLPPKRARAMETAWKAMGLLSSEQDLREEVLSLYGSQVGGFYDPQRGALFLLADMHPVLQTPVVRHELAHALQDQHWDLSVWLAGAELDEDRAAAMQAVLEGHANDTMNRATLKAIGLDAATLEATTDPGLIAELQEIFGEEILDGGGLSNLGLDESLTAAFLPRSTPAALRAQLLFPYALGTKFVAGYRKSHPDDPSCAALFRRPPQSTAEVLNPALWLAGFKPRLTQPGGFLPGWEQAWSSPLGRLLSQVALTNQGDPYAGNRSAADWDPVNRDINVGLTATWGGDHVVVYEQTQRESGTDAPDSDWVVWVSDWGSPAHAAAVAHEGKKRFINARFEVIGSRLAVLMGGSSKFDRSAFDLLAEWK